jgi:hypothetical protein
MVVQSFLLSDTVPRLYKEKIIKMDEENQYYM